MRGLHLTFVLVSKLFIGACSRRSAAQKVNSGIEGRWVMPRSWSMRIELNLRPDETYREDFSGDMTGFDGLTTGKYTYDPNAGVLTYVHSTFHRTSANGLELLKRSDSWDNWKAKKEIYVTLIKISDDPNLEVGHIEKGNPILDLLYSNGVTRN